MSGTTALRRQALRGIGKFLAVLAVLVFLPVWSLGWWQDWVFLGVVALTVSATTLHLLRHDPALVARRMRAGPTAEREPVQKLIQTFTSIALLALVVFPGLDLRFGWSHLSPLTILIGDVLIVVGFLATLVVFRSNTHASAIVEVTPDQRVVSTGPYRYVRHPMYSAALILILGVPLALGSGWGLLLCIPFAALLVWRLRAEEAFLAANLPGYVAYQATTRFRLVPWVW